MFRTVIISIFSFALCTLASVYAQAPSAPLMDGYNHTGVASCATAGCHGDQVAGPGAGPVVGQNEYFRWRAFGESGAHSRAYEVLLTPHAQRIARNLGIGPAQKADECLDCHADNVPDTLRSERFQISDGVGCEACHGGAQDWLAFHRSSADHALNVEAGLYPTEDPSARAQLCLNCHLGSGAKNQFVSHKIMGAGHPRLKFELDLYTTIQQHHRTDAGYSTRKTVAPGAQVWAIGQVSALQRTLDLLLDKKISGEGPFPELFFFDCHACHQPISSGLKDLSWRPNPLRPLGPGVPILNDANLFMLIAAARGLDTVLAERLENNGRALHAASLQSSKQFRRSAIVLRATTDEMASRVLSADFSDPAMVRAILREVVDASLAERYTNYAAAEQALFAVQRLSADLELNSTEMTTAIEQASNHVQSPSTYDQIRFRDALRKIETFLEQ